MKWARGQMTDDELDVELLMHDFRRRIDGTQIPGGRAVIHFVFPGLAKFEHWWIVFEGDGDSELCTENPGKPVDIQLRTDLRTMTEEIWAGIDTGHPGREEGRPAAAEWRPVSHPDSLHLAAHRHVCGRPAGGERARGLGGRATVLPDNIGEDLAIYKRAARDLRLVGLRDKP